MSAKVTTSMKAKKTVTNCIVHVILAILSFVWVVPIIWVILTSFRKQKGAYVTSFFVIILVPQNMLLHTVFQQ